MLVEIWSDVVCPWCYLGKRRFEAALARFEHAAEVEVRWRSFELDPSAPAERAEGMAGHLAAKYGLTVAQAEARLSQMDELAAGEGLAYDLARTRGGNTFEAHQLIHLAYETGPEAGAATKEALLHAYFVELQPIGRREVLLEVAAAVGLDRDAVEAALASGRLGPAVRDDERVAGELGCTGVPFFVIDRAIGVAGAQPADTFLDVLRQAWSRSHPALEVVGGDGACTDGACAL